MIIVNLYGYLSGQTFVGWKNEVTMKGIYIWSQKDKSGTHVENDFSVSGCKSTKKKQIRLLT
jgi:hypothetical protein